MKTLLLLLLFGSCASYEIPSWVKGIQSGEERLIVTNGDRILYRKIGTSCSKAIRTTERLIRKSYDAVPVLEVQFETEAYCAVTMSISAKAPKAAPRVVPQIGMDLWQVRKHLNSYVNFSFDYNSYCWQEYNEAGYSHHGDYIVCWKKMLVVAIYDVD